MVFLAGKQGIEIKTETKAYALVLTRWKGTCQPLAVPGE